MRRKVGLRSSGSSWITDRNSPPPGNASPFFRAETLRLCYRFAFWIHSLWDEQPVRTDVVGHYGYQVDHQFWRYGLQVADQSHELRWSLIENEDQPKSPSLQAVLQAVRECRRIDRVLLVCFQNGRQDRSMTASLKVSAQRVALQRCDFRTAQIRRVGKDLCHDRSPSLCITGQLHFDDCKSAARLHRDEISVSGAQPNLTTKHHQLRAARQRQQLRGFLDQAVQRSLIRKADRTQDPPAAAVVSPCSRHSLSVSDTVHLGIWSIATSIARYRAVGL
jgi:hypothetical protein